MELTIQCYVKSTTIIKHDWLYSRDIESHILPACLTSLIIIILSPHHGAGAGIGVEDALALCTLIEMVINTLSESSASNWVNTPALIGAALQAYDEVRMPRSQWLVKSSREACDIYEWNYPTTKTDWDRCMTEITARSHKLWYFDIEGMLEDLRKGYSSRTSSISGEVVRSNGPVNIEHKGEAETVF
ncbi:hypothetical protein NUW58_g6151 [Xylaria curta]|uniref:Uncharacterized protein n=1 Tax=Xylaria curta TaxID=42375 RepID=A0ACC1P0D1_9PEZI|nr:hypothetical protein NUW58_g6151 [Xylaria curta]